MNLNLSKLRAGVGLSADTDTSKIHLNPARDWLLLLALFFILTLGVSVYSYDLFLGIYGEETTVPAEDVDKNQIAYSHYEKDLSSTLGYYEQKNTAYNQLLDEGVDTSYNPSGVFIKVADDTNEIEVVTNSELTQ